MTENCPLSSLFELQDFLRVSLQLAIYFSLYLPQMENMALCFFPLA